MDFTWFYPSKIVISIPIAIGMLNVYLSKDGRYFTSRHKISSPWGFYRGLSGHKTWLSMFYRPSIAQFSPWIQVAGWSVPSRNSTTEFPFEDKLHIHIYIYIFIISEDFLSCWVFGSPPNTIPTIFIKIRFSSPIGVSEICKTYQLLTLVKPFLAVRVRRWSSRLTRRKRDRSIQSWSLVTGVEYENMNGISMGFNES